MSEQDAVHDAYVADLERALGLIMRPATLPQDARRIAAEALGEGAVVRIPDGITLVPRQVTFTRFPFPGGHWCLIGPADMLVTGTVIEVERFNGTRKPRDTALVAVGHVVAERTVIHKDTGPARYVIARVSRAVKED